MTRSPSPTRRMGAVELLITWHPLALAISYVLISFSATPLPPAAIVRPMLIAVVTTLIVQGVLWAITRRRYLAAAVTGGLVLILSAAWLPLALGVAIGAWVIVVRELRRRRGMPVVAVAVDTVGRPFALVVWVMVVVAAVPVGAILLESVRPARAEAAPPTGEASDVVVLLLDGYPRQDALRRMGGDNGAFLGALRDRGFTTADGARSNYTSTWATLASMFHGEALEDVEELEEPYPDDPAAQYRALMALISEAPALQPLRDRGYEIVTMPPTLEGAQLTAADRVVTSPELTAFELSLIQRSPLGNLALRIWPELPYRQHRARTESTLRLVAAELARPSDRPRFVFAHVTSPHAPVVANADGRDADPPSCFPDCSMYVFGSLQDWDRLPGHLTHLNDLVLDVVDEVIAARREATIVLMSDHGLRKPGQPEADILRSFFSMRAPSGSVAPPNDIEPLDVLRVLAGITPPDRPYRAWISEEERPLDMRPYQGVEP